MLSYNFGPQHPLNPERLRRAIALLEHFGWSVTDPGPGTDESDVARVHDDAYIDLVADIDSQKHVSFEDQFSVGFGSGDNPPFEGMFKAALAYVAGSAQAARAVSKGAPLAFGLAGGLHHARRAQASGFCIFNDCAVACSILRERFSKVAYVDIDVHHGEGVQWIFHDDPTVMTCSIHQDGRTLYPGTGGVEETGANGTSVNVPVPPGTTGNVWLWGFKEGILPLLKRFKPEAIVLQMGCDSHFLDPLARVQNNTWCWLEAVKDIQSLGLPIVALGGGGYDLGNVPRMWTAACLSLAGFEIPERVPEPYATEWGIPAFHDLEKTQPENRRTEVEATVQTLRRLHDMAI